MKNLLIILLVILISGCHTSKKISKSDIKTDKETETNQVTASKEKQNIEFDKNSDQETTNIHIKFSAPAKNVPSTDPIHTGIPEVDDQLKGQNLGIHGSVESITISTTKSRDTDKSKLRSEKEDQSETTSKAKDQSSEKTEIKEKIKPDRSWMKWLIIPGVLALGFLTYKKWALVKSVLSPAGKKYKI